MTAPPLSLADEIAQHLEAFGGTEEEAAAAVTARRTRKAEVAASTDPAVLLPAIRDTLKLDAKIERISKTISTPAQYTMHTDQGAVVLGTAKQWATRPTDFSAAFLDIGEMPAMPQGPARNTLCTMIARAAEPEDIGVEATDGGWTRSMLAEYLAARPPVDSLQEALGSEYPWTDTDGHVVIFGRRLQRWLTLEYQERLTPVEFGKRLRGVGCEPYIQGVGNPDGTRSTRSCWRLPRDLG